MDRSGRQAGARASRGRWSVLVGACWIGACQQPDSERGPGPCEPLLEAQYEACTCQGSTGIYIDHDETSSPST